VARRAPAEGAPYMTARHAPRLAIALLERFVPDSDPLLGDLIEDFERRPSSGWFWWQVLTAIVAATWSFDRPAEIRPLRLVELPPVDAIERSRRMSLRFQTINLSASPLSGVGGLGLVALTFLVTTVAPRTWWVVLASTLVGLLVGVGMIAMRARPPEPLPTIRPDSIRAR
jgi:hypothetical protein